MNKFKVLIVYIFISILIGEFHPFSSFPMFSSFPPDANYYYLADTLDQPIYNSKNTGVYCSELADLMDAHIQSDTSHKDYFEKEQEAADIVIKKIATKFQDIGCWKLGNGVRLKKKTFYIEDNRIYMSDIILAKWSQQNECN